MVNYKKGKIYKLYNCETNKCYFGFTTQTLGNRKYNHMNDSSSSTLLYEDDGEIKIELLEKVKTKEDAIIRERYYIENFDCVNKKIPGRTHAERWQQKKHLELVKVQCECGALVGKTNMIRHKRTKKHLKNLNSIVNGKSQETQSTEK